MERVFNYTVGNEYDGETVKNVIKKRFKMSTSLIKTLKSYDDGILVNGRHSRVVDVVRGGDKLALTLRDVASENITPVNIPLDIVYEDEDILVINKPPRMPTHISAGNYENSVANAVMYYYKSRGEDRVFRAVNRLDKDTSGLMTVAKNAYIHARLSDEIRTGELRRKYMCVVCGDIDKDGTVDAPIKRAEGSAISRTVAADGHRAVTHYKVMERYGGYTRLLMELETGRTHQIRVHMACIGRPLAGDWLYGEENRALVPRQMLHSCYLRLVHPVTNETLEFNAPMPYDMSEFVQKVSQKS